MNTDLSHLLQSSGWPAVVAAVFLGGLALNLTPCVYPMIPITISYFGGTGDGGHVRRTGLVRAVLFVLGMAITYSLLGVSAALAGRIFGASLGNPWVVAVVSGVLVLMALSMFGVFQMTAPSSLLSRLQETRDKMGWLGAFFFGLVIGVVMAPCVGPIITALLALVAASGSPVVGFWLFFTLAMGMGLPYIFLGYFASALKSLPRAGTWMLWLERFFGLVLLGYAYSLWMPFISSLGVARVVLAAYVLAAAVFLAFLRTPGARPGFRFVKATIVVAMLAVSAWMGLLAQHALQDEQRPAGGPSSAVPTRVEWLPYSDEALAQALAARKPVMIDFYAKWCVACNELDEKTYTDPRVIGVARGFVCLKADFTKVPDVESSPIAKRFKIQGLPTVVFFSPDGKERNDLRTEEFVDPERMLALMEAAAK